MESDETVNILVQQMLCMLVWFFGFCGVDDDLLMSVHFDLNFPSHNAVVASLVCFCCLASRSAVFNNAEVLAHVSRVCTCVCIMHFQIFQYIYWGFFPLIGLAGMKENKNPNPVWQ